MNPLLITWPGAIRALWQKKPANERRDMKERGFARALALSWPAAVHHRNRRNGGRIMKVAIVHEWLESFTGSERVVEQQVERS